MEIILINFIQSKCVHTSLVTTCMIDSGRSQEKNQIYILNKFHIYDIPPKFPKKRYTSRYLEV